MGTFHLSCINYFAVNALSTSVVLVWLHWQWLCYSSQTVLTVYACLAPFLLLKCLYCIFPSPDVGGSISSLFHALECCDGWGAVPRWLVPSIVSLVGLRPVLWWHCLSVCQLLAGIVMSVSHSDQEALCVSRLVGGVWRCHCYVVSFIDVPRLLHVQL